MRGRSVVVGAVALALTGSLALLICFGKRESHPPILSVVRVEPAGVLDDNGLELQMVSLSISAPTNLRSRPAEPLFVRTGAISVEAKVADRWVRVDGGLWKGCELWPGSPHETVIATPAHTVSCRLRLEYTGSLLSETRVRWVAARLPTGIPFHQRVWDWLGKIGHMPSGNWREIIIEMSLPPESAR